MTGECTGNECEYGGRCRGDAPCGGCCGCVGACLAAADQPDPVAVAEEAMERYGQHVPTGFACCSAHAAADTVPDLIVEIKELRHRLEGLER